MKWMLVLIIAATLVWPTVAQAMPTPSIDTVEKRIAAAEKHGDVTNYTTTCKREPPRVRCTVDEPDSYTMSISTGELMPGATWYVVARYRKTGKLTLWWF